MFLPVLLVRDYGVWGWVAFAVPNVVGAAAMGFVLSPGRSAAVVEKHGAACVLFGRVTMWYQVAIVPWLVVKVLAVATPLAYFVVAAVFVIVCVLCMGRMKLVWGAVLAITAVSVAMFAWYSQQPAFAMGLGEAEAAPRLGVTDLMLFVPASVTGFMLCPYLDLTFHRARQATTCGTGWWAFAIGFGVVFLAMIVFSLSYAGHVGRALAGRTLYPAVLGVLAVHVLLQAGLTTGLHLRELKARLGSIKLDAALLAGMLLLGIYLAESYVSAAGSITRNEAFYRCFLLFYGLAFPAYVWLCMIPTWRRTSLYVKSIVCVASVVVAAPMGYGGFVMGRSWWILAALGVLAAARIVVEALPASATAGAPPRSVNHPRSLNL
jgi:hypothetical protein